MTFEMAYQHASKSRTLKLHGYRIKISTFSHENYMQYPYTKSDLTRAVGFSSDLELQQWASGNPGRITAMKLRESGLWSDKRLLKEMGWYPIPERMCFDCGREAS